jgi:hypothetical protein
MGQPQERARAIDRLEKFRKYQATISLSGLETFAHNLMVQAKLMEAGFTNVYVHGTGSTRIATGVWSRESQPIVNMPSQVSDVKEL